MTALPLLRRLHRWLGLLLAVPLLIQGVTGAVLALTPVLPNLAAVATTRGEPAGAGAIIAAAQASLPPGLRVSRYLPAAAPGETAHVRLVAESGPRGPGRDVRIDPVSLAVVDPPAGDGLIDWIKALHTNLLIEGRSGRSIIGWIGVGLLALAMLGVVLWWPPPGQWRAAVTADPRARGHGFHRRLHGMAGIWSLTLLLATSFTGVVLAFPLTMRGTLGLAAADPRRPAQQVAAPAVDVDRAIGLAEAAAPGLRVRAVLLPVSSAEPVRILLVPPGAEGAVATVAVAVDAATSRALSVQDPRTMPAAERALRWAHDLHFGQAPGPLWRALTIVTGLLLPIFAITGGGMWLCRRRRRVPALQTGE
jgi:uncharacterized iron-regulated membrane protein